jgi:hypothetical protein
VGETSLHPLPVFIFSPRATFTPATLVVLLAIIVLLIAKETGEMIVQHPWNFDSPGQIPGGDFISVLAHLE